ncbi:MAG TPA: hypothetical protein ENI52_01345 [Thermoplasmata archaeon]|nr:hypothetical protein [Thermoplasmata archaeon]
MVRKYIIGMCVITVFVVILSGCVKEESPKAFKVEIEKGTDDGVMYILAELYPDIVAGFVTGGTEGVFVGVVVSGGGDTIINRALYRFDISDWNGGDITFHVHCTYKNEVPGKLEVYVVNDFGELPEQQSQDPEDISYLWNNINNGTKVAEAEPNQGDWIEITIPENAIVDTNTLALVLKLKNENMSGYAYGFSTYEYAEKYNEDKPYIEWKVK